ncbi:MAG: efflux RND transporter periplasmic adaptor subunit [Alistipes sp.]|nr:efflux RND transporter periplasmic adaptor subunit [Alistipes sp.]
MRNKNPLTAAIVLLAALAATGCDRQPTADAAERLEIEMATARTDSLYVRRSFISEIGSDSEVVIEPRVSGFLAARHYRKGMPVRKGQLLFEIDNREYYSALLSAQAALESSKALALEAKNNYDRAVPLAGINAISAAQLDQYTARYAAARADVKAAEQAVRNAGLNLSYTKIYSPIDGIIESSNAGTGDLVGPGTQIPTLTTIMNIDTVTVSIAIPMAQFLALDGDREMIYDNAGLLSDIVLYEDDGTRYQLAGKYDYTRTAVSTATGTIVLIVRFPNPAYRLKAGQFARIEANLGAKRPRVLVPQQSVSQILDASSVWVIRADSTAEYRRITPGETFGGMWAVESGLRPGERVAVTGIQKLREGMRVIPSDASKN